MITPGQIMRLLLLIKSIHDREVKKLDEHERFLVGLLAGIVPNQSKKEVLDAVRSYCKNALTIDECWEKLNK